MPKSLNRKRVSMTTRSNSTISTILSSSMTFKYIFIFPYRKTHSFVIFTRYALQELFFDLLTT